MKKRRCPPVPLAVTKISPKEIILRSTFHSSPLIILSGISGGFLLAGGMAHFWSDLTYLPFKGALVALIGLVAVMFAFVTIQNTYKITIDGSYREIRGLITYPQPIDFSRITRIGMNPRPNTPYWDIFVDVSGIGAILLVPRYPMDLAVSLGENLSRIIARPFEVSDDVPKSLINQPAWTLQYRMREARYPLEWVIIAATLAIVIVMLVDAFPLNPLHFGLWPKLLLVLLSGGLGAFLVDRIQYRSTNQRAIISVMLLFVLVFVESLIGTYWPTEIALSITPGISLLLLSAIFWPTRKLRTTLMIFGIIGLLVGVPFSAKSIFYYYELMNLNPGVIEKIVFDTRTIHVSSLSNPQFVFEEPRDIRPIITTMLNCKPYEGEYKYKTSGIWMEIIRPYGQNFNLKIRRDRAGFKNVALISMYIPFMGLNIPMGVYSSEKLEDYFIRNRDDFSFWIGEKKNS